MLSNPFGNLILYRLARNLICTSLAENVNILRRKEIEKTEWIFIFGEVKSLYNILLFISVYCSVNSAMGKRKQKVRWSSVDGISWSCNDQVRYTAK